MTVCNKVIFIDETLPHLEVFANSEYLAKIVYLRHDLSLAFQIAQTLNEFQNVEQIHLITHGHSGEILLGANGLSLETLPLYGKELLSISNAMKSDGELYLYGCEVAAGERGEAFVKMLGDLTGLKVAAASHKVGHEELGGSWELDMMSEVMSGTLAVSEWRGVLAGTTTQTKKGYVVALEGTRDVFQLGGAFIDANGNIVLGGGTYTTDWSDGDGFVVRFNSSGELDDTFAGDGGVTINPSNPSDTDLDGGFDTLIPHGTGFLAHSYNNPVITKLDANGALDSSWGSSGTLTIEDSSRMYGITADSTGNTFIIYSLTSSPTTIKIAKITSSGAVDTSWGTDGKISSSVGTPTDIVVLADGSIVASGRGSTTANNEWVINKFNADGSPATFGTEGVAIVDLNEAPYNLTNADHSSAKITVAENGEIYITRTQGVNNPTSGEKDSHLFRLKADGTPDETFGNNGFVQFDSTENAAETPLADYSNGVALQSDGKILLTGSSVTSPESITVSRLNHDGTLDYTFGNYGTAFFQLGEEYAGYGNYASTAIQQADGKIVVVGETWNTDWDKVWTFAARLNSDGTLDNTFGTSEFTTSFTLNISDAQTWLRPDPDNYTGTGDPLGYGVFDSVTANTTTPYNYAYVKFTPTATGKYDLKISDTTLNDSMFFVYDNTNGDFGIEDLIIDQDTGEVTGGGAITGTFLIGDDDSAGGFGFASTSDFIAGPEGSGGDMVYRSALNDLTLTANTQYVFVVSSYEAADAGNIEFSLSGPGGVTLGEGSFAAEPVILDLDQVGDGNADTNNSTGLVDWYVPVYIADSATVLGDDAPASYKNLIISVDTTGWSEESWAGFGVNAEVIEDIEDSGDYVLLSAGGTSKVFDPDEYGGETEIKVQVAGTLGDGVVTLTFTDYQEGNIPKEDLNTLLQNIFFYEDGEEFSDTRVFNISVTDADDNVSEISTFSATWAPDTEAPYYDGMGNSDSFETPIPTDYFNAEDGNYISFYLNEDVTPVAGKYIKLWKEVADGEDLLVGSYEVTDEDAVYVDEDEIEFYPNLNTLDSSTTYYFTVDAGAFKDSSDNVFEAYDGSDWSFSTAAPSLGTWNIADADPASDGIQPTVSSSGTYRGNLEISANGKYVVMGENLQTYKASISSQSGLSVKKINADGTWSYVGEQAFTSTSGSSGLYDLVVVTEGELDTLYTLSVSNTDADSGPNTIAVHTFKDGAWVNVGSYLNVNVGAFVSNLTLEMQPPKLLNDAEGIGAAYYTNLNGTPKIEVKYAIFTDDPSTMIWQDGGSIDVDSTEYGFDFLPFSGTLLLGVADPVNQNVTFRYYAGNQSWNDDVIPPLSMVGMTGDSTLGSTLKMVLDGNVLYAVYGKNDSGTTEIAISKIDLSAQNLTWQNLPAPLDGKNDIAEGGMHFDLAFDAQKVPHLSMTNGDNLVNVYKFDDESSSWLELDTGSSLDDIDFNTSADLEIHDGELNLLVSDYNAKIYHATFEPNAEEDNSSVTLNVANPFTPNVSDDTTAITIDAPDGISITGATNSAVAGLPKNVKMPLGQFGFTLSGLENGATVEMSMTADADFKQFSYFKKNLVTNKWVNIMEGVTVNDDGTATVKFSLTDGGVYDADRTANGVIVDPGGVGENALLPMILENTTEVGNVSLLDEDAATGTLSYAITGGADSTKFTINSTTGLLSFNSAPNYESPTDEGDTAANNTYAVQVTVTGSTSGTEVQNLVVSVLNVAENGDNPNTAPVIVGLRAEAQAVTVGTAAALDDIRVVDADSDTMTVTLTATNGTIGGLTDADAITAGIQLTGNAATINTALVGATFRATAAGDAGVSITVVDDTAVTDGTDITTTAYYAMSAAAAPTPPPPVVVIPPVEPTPVEPTPVEPTPVEPTPPEETTTEVVDGAVVETGTNTQEREVIDENGNTTIKTVITDTLVIAPVTDNRTDTTGTTATADVPLFWGESTKTEWATTANLPVGVGLATDGSRAPKENATLADAIDDLIYYIDTTVDDSDPDKANQKDGGSSFLSKLENKTDTLVVNKIVLNVDANTVTISKPITISGSANVVATSQSKLAPMEALVIDGSTLPRNTQLDLKNVEFAVIVGENLTVRGGDGANILFAGAGSQNIVLGEDNDELYGGAGDDIIGSVSGDDIVYGEDGDDIVFGGVGRDILSGGTGNDTINGGLGYDTALQEGAKNDYNVLVSNGTITLTNKISGSIDTLIDINQIEFDNGDIFYIANNKIQEKILLTMGHNKSDILYVSAVQNIKGTNNDDNFDFSSNSLGLSLDGLSGNDTLKIDGDTNDFRIEDSTNGIEITSLIDGTVVELINFESIEFDSGTDGIDVVIIGINDNNLIL